MLLGKRWKKNVIINSLNKTLFKKIMLGYWRKTYGWCTFRDSIYVTTTISTHFVVDRTSCSALSTEWVLSSIRLFDSSHSTSRVPPSCLYSVLLPPLSLTGTSTCNQTNPTVSFHGVWSTDSLSLNKRVSGPVTFRL